MRYDGKIVLIRDGTKMLQLGDIALEKCRVVKFCV